MKAVTKIKINSAFMNKWKVLSIVFVVISFGAVQETVRIFTSNAPDIANNRTELIPMSVIMTGLFIFLAIKFWRKA